MGRYKKEKPSAMKRIGAKRRLYPDYEYIEVRFERSGKIRVRPLAGKRRSSKPVEIHLLPRDRNQLGDVIIMERPVRYYAFLDHMDVEEDMGGERRHTLWFDCMLARFVASNIQAMLRPDFPFDEIADAAGSCLIELSLPEQRFQTVEAHAMQVAKELGRFVQPLVPGSWWALEERRVPAPNTALGVKHLPFPGSGDPTTIVSAGSEDLAVVHALEVPPDDELRALVALSHPGELAGRYPGR
jgi:hypothetical protein